MRGFAAVLAGVAVGVCAAQARAHDGEPGHRHAVTRTVVLAQAQESLTDAGARILTTVSATDELVSGDPATQEQLALMLGAPT